MYTRSKSSFLALAALLIVTLAAAQPMPVTITIAVAPPYSNKIDDYISQPNKIMATIINILAWIAVALLSALDSVEPRKETLVRNKLIGCR